MVKKYGGQYVVILKSRPFPLCPEHQLSVRSANQNAHLSCAALVERTKSWCSRALVLRKNLNGLNFRSSFDESLLGAKNRGIEVKMAVF